MDGLSPSTLQPAQNSVASDSSYRAPGDSSDRVAGRGFQERDVLRVFDGAIESFGHLDAIVINAGIVGPSMPLAEIDGERVQRMVAVNTLGALFCAQEAIRCMSRSRGGCGGSIVLVSSMAAKLGSPFEYVDYAVERGARYTYGRPRQGSRF